MNGEKRKCQGDVRDIIEVQSRAREIWINWILASQFDAPRKEKEETRQPRIQPRKDNR